MHSGNSIDNEKADDWMRKRSCNLNRLPQFHFISDPVNWTKLDLLERRLVLHRLRLVNFFFCDSND